MLDLHDLEQFRNCVTENPSLGFQVLPFINSKRLQKWNDLKNLVSCKGLSPLSPLHLLCYSLLWGQAIMHCAERRAFSRLDSVSFQDMSVSILRFLRPSSCSFLEKISSIFNRSGTVLISCFDVSSFQNLRIIQIWTFTFILAGA